MTPSSSDTVTFLGIEKAGAMNLLYRKSRVEWRQKEEEPKKSSGKVRDMASFRRHFRMGFMTMPASQERAPLPCASAMAPRSLSCHSVGSAPEDSGNEGGPPGRRPPAKPKRNPSTKLSLGGEGRTAEERRIRKEGSIKSASDTRRMPPQKPQRSPHTHLSASFDDAYANRPASTSAILTSSNRTSSPSPEEPVYIEMVGNASRRPPPPPTPAPPEEESDGEEEAIYEEMKYPLHEEQPSHLRHPQRRRLPPPRTPEVDIPPPFPNLLQHRPPLLGAPSGKGQKVTKPSQPAASSKLPVPHKEMPSAASSSSVHLPPSGRARSHSTPLPPQTSAQRRPESETPRGSTFSQEKGSSMLPIPHGHNRDKALSYTMVYSSVKVTHSLLPASQVEEKTEREISVLAGLICPASRVAGTQLPSRPPSAHLHQVQGEQASPAVWTYPTGKRPPAYETSIKGSRTPVVQASETRVGVGAAEEERPGSVWELQRRMSCGRRSQLGEPLPDAPRVWNGNPGRPEKTGHGTTASGIPVRSQQSLDSALARGVARTGLPVPCQTFPACHRSADFGGGYRLGRSASTSGVRQTSAHRQNQNIIPKWSSHLSAEHYCCIVIILFLRRAIRLHADYFPLISDLISYLSLQSLIHASRYLHYPCVQIIAPLCTARASHAHTLIFTQVTAFFLQSIPPHFLLLYRSSQHSAEHYIS
ncbi:neuronal tyrosine-phosphorylated phosphoinositide-3-kinase adapter 1 isoform X2 [Bufo bufo]|uniref:neuronal tyrosine-phosphorylated phosphoinositide-3-kinase adapter 1 isoform X2 n=1 Tax=Bufo bufo TaxID=8384 RepID=UPI001ABE3268|nr:neuronal tyrosine-phosphorylated phosphoinositide-3-kinase adapter 1 isoform X2 [Bufo bufo]